MDRREERDATRRRKVEVDQALQQLDCSLSVFDDSIEEVVTGDYWEGTMLKHWEPLTCLQKKKTILESLRRQGKDGNEELKVAVSEIEDRLRLVRGINGRRCKRSHGPSAERDYKEARLWLNTVAVKLHVGSSRVVRGSRQRKGNLIPTTKGGGSKGKLGGVQMLSSKLDSNDEHLVSRYRYHLHKIEKMREELDRDKLSPEDVMSIQPDIDQFLGEIGEDGELDEAMDSIWDCVDLDTGSQPDIAAEAPTGEHDGSFNADDEEDSRRSSNSSSGTPSKKAGRKHHGRRRGSCDEEHINA